MITNDARCTGEIKFSTAMKNVTLNRKKTLLTTELKLKEATSKVLHAEH
jgi:hypothetical protein